jgi:hypothetical protein
MNPIVQGGCEMAKTQLFKVAVANDGARFTRMVRQPDRCYTRNA